MIFKDTDIFKSLNFFRKSVKRLIEFLLKSCFSDCLSSCTYETTLYFFKNQLGGIS